jgi:CDP-4-dehydro-6-deoxyglucose reductase, E1
MAELLRKEIFKKVEGYYRRYHRPGPFIPGKSRVPYAGRVYGAEEMVRLVDSALDFWLTAGRFADELEGKFKNYFQCRDFFLVNSGSSANLILLATLCSRILGRHLKAGDEVITPAVTFPTTLTPVLQHGLVPVFVDVEAGTYNIDPYLIEKAISAKTRAIFVPHTLGNPCDMETIMAIARRHKLFVLEDSCDALGARFNGKLAGTFGDLASLSFYPAHHMTMGEGGGVVVNNPQMARLALSLRDWGRDCWCKTGENNTCKKRFSWKLGDLPYGYDHKYVYSSIGYNLKITDMQAAVGLAQFDKLDSFIKARNRNFEYYRRNLIQFEDYLALPRIHPKAKPSWFGFPITVEGGVSRLKLIRWLEDSHIETRLVFAGNIIRQPAFKNIKCRIPAALKESDRVMNDTFFIGVYPGLTRPMQDFVIKRFGDFFKDKSNLE